MQQFALRMGSWFRVWPGALALCGLVQAVPAETITWVGTDFPPMAMSQGEYAHEGYIDELYKHLQSALPQYSFQEETVPWSRAMLMAQRGGPYCLIAAFQTPEREAFLRFTPPYGYLYPIGVVTRASDQSQFAAYVSKSGDFQLDKALKSPQLGMGVASSRSYGAKIDELLKPLIASGAANVQQVYQDESTKVLLAMLARQRFDYMLAYPSEVEFYGGTPNPFRFYPIEGNSALLPGRFSCTKSPETDRVYGDVAKLALAKKTQATFRVAYERWLPQYLIRSYRQRLQEIPASSP